MAKQLITEKVTTYKRKKIIYKAAQILSYILPIIILLIVRRKNYFTEYNGYRMTIGCVVSAIIVVVTATKGFKFLGVTGWCIALAVISYLMKEVFYDITLIAAVETLCTLLGTLFGKLHEKYAKLYEKYVGAIVNKEVNYSSEHLQIDEKGNIVQS